jgi:hypothetical protein
MQGVESHASNPRRIWEGETEGSRIQWDPGSKINPKTEQNKNPPNNPPKASYFVILEKCDFNDLIIC